MVQPKKLLIFGLLAELLIMLWSYFEANGSLLMFFKSAARLSGRLSLFYFAWFFMYSLSQKQLLPGKAGIHFGLANNFAIIHVIHWFFLASAIYLGNVQLEFVRVLGGLLAYLLIVALPIAMRKGWIKARNWPRLSTVYFYYVWLIFALTYVARLSGNSSFASGSMASYMFFAACTALLFIYSIYVKLVRK